MKPILEYGFLSGMLHTLNADYTGTGVCSRQFYLYPADMFTSINKSREYSLGMFAGFLIHATLILMAMLTAIFLESQYLACIFPGIMMILMIGSYIICKKSRDNIEKLHNGEK